MKAMPEEWFEMPEILKRSYDKSVWIPLKETKHITKEGKAGHAGFKEEYNGVCTLAVPLDQRGEAEKIEWSDLGHRSSDSGYLDEDGYVPSHVYKNSKGTLSVEKLIIVSNGENCHEWHLCQDLLTTLNLIREGDNWLALDYGYEEVVKVERDEDGCFASIQIKASYLKDYLCARKMALYLTTFRQRTQIVEDASNITWADEKTKDFTLGYWSGRKTLIHEGGMRYGEEFLVYKVSRTDVDFDEDIPTPSFPKNGDTKSEIYESKYSGRQLYRIDGELWKNEWVNPADISPIVVGDKAQPTVFFTVDNQGKNENRNTLLNGIRWLWFKPSVVLDILSIRGSSLRWYTKDTGNLSCSSDYGVHFGINSIGLINVLAKDIAQLPDWQQRIWAGHNIAPDGKVSAELLMSQMKAEPAESLAPEEYIQPSIDLINKRFSDKYGFTLIKDHLDSKQQLTRLHRFRANNADGLYALAKDLYRFIGEKINAAEIKKIVKPKKEDSWGPLKSIEKLIALETDEETAYKLLSPLWGLYKLRNADSHISFELDEAYKLAGISQKESFTDQGYKLIHSCVDSLHKISKVLKAQDKSDK